LPIIIFKIGKNSFSLVYLFTKLVAKLYSSAFQKFKFLEIYINILFNLVSCLYDALEKAVAI